MSKNVFRSSTWLLPLMICISTLLNFSSVAAKAGQESPASPNATIFCGDIFAKANPLEPNFQQCRYERDQFREVQTNLQTIKNQLTKCPTHECFLQWGEILDHVRGEIFGNLTLTQRSFDLSKETRLEWEQEWMKIDKEENRIRRDAYNKGLQRQRATHESDYLTLE